MAYFDDPKHVEAYMNMVESYEGGDLIETVKEYIPPGASVLELGMGPGTDLDMLSELYVVTGSDSSQVFIDLYREKHPEADLLVLDASTLNTERSFDALYSNKVLMHLSREECIRSFQRQMEILNPGGVVFHTFWIGEGEQFIEDLRFVYYSPDAMKELVAEALPSGTYELTAVEAYAEEKEGDSFYIVIRKV